MFQSFEGVSGAIADVMDILSQTRVGLKSTRGSAWRREGDIAGDMLQYLGKDFGIVKKVNIVQ